MNMLNTIEEVSIRLLVLMNEHDEIIFSIDDLAFVDLSIIKLQKYLKSDSDITSQLKMTFDFSKYLVTVKKCIKLLLCKELVDYVISEEGIFFKSNSSTKWFLNNIADDYYNNYLNYSTEIVKQNSSGKKSRILIDYLSSII
ncbi:hypothetical protein RJG79_00640 [Mycoplasmatota bacterium WC44]